MNVPEKIEILLVEDNPLDAEFTMRALKSGGIANRLTWVKDGQEALDYLFREGSYAGRDTAAPGLVLLDLKMPKMSGLEVLQAVRGNDDTKRIPVVVMTSSREDVDVTCSYDLGANSYIVKPVDSKAFIDTVTNAGFYWLAINVSAPA
jgi:two-component system, response regulator